jgi:hypothetical protein
MKTPGLYVHYKGGIYFVHGTARDGDDTEGPNRHDEIVIYESANAQGSTRFWRKLENFNEVVDPTTGKPSVAEGAVFRFQRVHGWHEGLPIVDCTDRYLIVYDAKTRTHVSVLPTESRR